MSQPPRADDFSSSSSGAAPTERHYSLPNNPPPYDLHRSPPTMSHPAPSTASVADSLDYSSQVDSEGYLDLRTALGQNSHQYNDQSSLATANVQNHAPQPPDATHIVHEMHLALLYLLSNPEEFQRALDAPMTGAATTLMEWNAEYDAESLTVDDGSTVAGGAASLTASLTPLPYVVFADDAEVVLPQAHTASQLFGLERVQGIELEAAAGIRPLSALFLRWLALMPQGDHLNLIEPPGLTVMKIAGGRYRVTAAHRVVWTWMNEFVPLLGDTATTEPLVVGDLVTLTIVDVFETDNQGKLLSYCPTFDNRAVHKTHMGTEALRKSTAQLGHLLQKARQSKLAKLVGLQAIKFAQTIKDRVATAVHYSPDRLGNNGSPPPPNSLPAPFGSRVDAVPSSPNSAAAPGSSHYMADDDKELHEV